MCLCSFLPEWLSAGLQSFPMCQAASAHDQRVVDRCSHSSAL